MKSYNSAIRELEKYLQFKYPGKTVLVKVMEGVEESSVLVTLLFRWSLTDMAHEYVPTEEHFLLVAQLNEEDRNLYVRGLSSREEVCLTPAQLACVVSAAEEVSVNDAPLFKIDFEWVSTSKF